MEQDIISNYVFLEKQELVQNTLNTLSKKIEKLNFDVFNFNNWVVVYDDSFTAYSLSLIHI